MICDPRLIDKPYGRRIWQSLPPMRRYRATARRRRRVLRRCAGAGARARLDCRGVRVAALALSRRPEAPGLPVSFASSSYSAATAASAARIAQSLAGDEGDQAVVAGRDAARAAADSGGGDFARRRQASAWNSPRRSMCCPAAIISQPRLKQLEPVARRPHPAGRVSGAGPRRCAHGRRSSAGAHCDRPGRRALGSCAASRAIEQTYGAARATRLVVSGASSVPTNVGGAVVDAIRARGVRRAHRSIVGISRASSGRQRGSATVAAITSYVGKQFRRRGAGGGVAARLRLAAAPAPATGIRPRSGTRWLADCDVPDLGLLPDASAGRAVRCVFERRAWSCRSCTSACGCYRGRSRWRWIPQPRRARRAVAQDAATGSRGLRQRRRARCTCGTCAGFAARIGLAGAVDAGGGPVATDRRCRARRPMVLARKLAAGALAARGAMPCLGLFSLDECSACAGRVRRADDSARWRRRGHRQLTRFPTSPMAASIGTRATAIWDCQAFGGGGASDRKKRCRENSPATPGANRCGDCVKLAMYDSGRSSAITPFDAVFGLDERHRGWPLAKHRRAAYNQQSARQDCRCHPDKKLRWCCIRCSASPAWHQLSG